MTKHGFVREAWILFQILNDPLAKFNLPVSAILTKYLLQLKSALVSLVCMKK